MVVVNGVRVKLRVEMDGETVSDSGKSPLHETPLPPESIWATALPVTAQKNATSAAQRKRLLFLMGSFMIFSLLMKTENSTASEKVLSMTLFVKKIQRLIQSYILSIW
jgi:hypothetical protein